MFAAVIFVSAATSFVFSCSMCMDGGRWDYKVKNEKKKNRNNEDKKETDKKEDKSSAK